MTSLVITTTGHYIFMRLRNWQLLLEPWQNFLQPTSQGSIAYIVLPALLSINLILAHPLKSMKESETVAPKLKLTIRLWPHMLVAAAAFTSVNEFHFSTLSLSVYLCLAY